MVQYTLVFLFTAFISVYGASYAEYDLIKSDICYERRIALFAKIDTLLDSRKQIKTLNEFQQGAIYEQVWNSSSFKRYSECKFTLQSQVGTGLYLIIRKLNLRRDPKGNCIDLVSIKQSSGKKSRFCYTPEDVPRKFFDKNNLKISIKLDSFVPLPSVEDMLQIQMVATQTRECTSSKDELQCESYSSYSCIHKSFVNDGVINCPNCTDEPSCSLVPAEVVVSNQNIALTAFVSLLTTATVFGTCLMCLYKNRQSMPLCSSGYNSGSGTDIGSRGGTRPSAPPLALDEKDLPPSYDALFPTAAVASSSAGPTTVSTATSPTIPKTCLDRESDTST
ncbi:uncharacterized protein LOC128724982 [Anopheles nili]|uniref:uncharacterized protein LOC128724982 n=1 Tax=Anopheles nili TaxID=185578 RepID=UPI00237B426D|nr:uncharacterized protein LOC128724982 [Anopheles nili]